MLLQSKKYKLKRSINVHSKTNLCFVGLLAVFISIACNRKEIAKNDIQKYIANPEKGLVQEVQTQSLSYRLIYKPANLLFMQAVPSAYQVPQNVYYFQLSLSTKDGQQVYALASTPDEIAEINQFLNFEIGEHIQLVSSGGDTLLPAAIDYNQAVNIGSSTDLLLCFESDKLLDSKNFVVEINKPLPIDHENVQLRFRTKDIKRIPKLRRDDKK